MKPVNPLESIYFINLSENTKFSSKALQLDLSIPLPVQKKENDDPGTFNMQELTEEQILAGLLTIMAYDSNNKNILYYRSILNQARPNLKKELTEAAILKAKNEDWDLAEEIFSSLHGFDPEDMGTVLNMALFFDQRADSYRRSGLNDDADAYDDSAANWYRDALDAEPAIPDAFFNAGFFYLKKYNYTEAKSCFETYQALTCDIKDEELGENGLYKKNRAQEILNEINNRNMEDDHFIKAHKLIQQDKEEEALDEIRQFLSHNPDVWNAWFMLGWALRRIGRFEDALKAFDKTRSLEGGDTADTLNEMSICCMELNDLPKAKEYLEKAYMKSPENTKIISNLGFLALKEGNLATAGGYFQTVLEYDPNDKIALNELKKLQQED